MDPWACSNHAGKTLSVMAAAGRAPGPGHVSAAHVWSNRAGPSSGCGMLSNKGRLKQRLGGLDSGMKGQPAPAIPCSWASPWPCSP